MSFEKNIPDEMKNHHDHYDHHDHSHEFDPDAKPPYVTFGLLILLVLIGLALVIYFKLI